MVNTYINTINPNMNPKIDARENELIIKIVANTVAMIAIKRNLPFDSKDQPNSTRAEIPLKNANSLETVPIVA